jgi:myosin heavy subunit
MAKLRPQIKAELSAEFEKRKSDLMNESHSLKLECEDQKKKIQELSGEVDAQKNTRQTERQTLKDKEVEIKKLTSRNAEVEALLRDAGKPCSIADLEARLQCTEDNLRTKEKDCQSLERERATDLQKLTELQAKQKHWQAETETLRTEAQKRNAETERLRTALEESKTLEKTLREDNTHLRSECDQSRALEKRENDAEAAFAVERDELRQQITELQVAKDESAESEARIRMETAEEIQKAADVSRSQIEDIRHQLKQAEAKNREMEAAHQLKIQYHRQKMEEKHQLLIKEVQQAPQRRQRATQLMVGAGTPAQTSRSQPSPTEEDDELPSNRRLSEEFRSESPRSGRRDQDLYSFFDEEFQNGYGTQQVLDPDAEVVIETQEVDLPRPLSAQSFEEQDLRSRRDSRHSRSPDLSSADSELMTQLEQDGCVNPPTLRGRDQNGIRQPTSRALRADTSNQTRETFGLESHSPFSQDRPKSQANTASRMMPPHGSMSQHLSPRVPQKSGGSSRSDRGSSVVSESHRITASKQAFSHHFDRQPEQDEETLLATPSNPSRKRRDMNHQHEYGMSPKKPRVLILNPPALRGSDSASPSVGAGSLRNNLPPLPQSKVAATPRRTSARLTKNKGE